MCDCFSDLKCFKSSCCVSGSYFDRACGVLEQVVLTVKVPLQVRATRIDGNGRKQCLSPPSPSRLLPPPRRDRLDFNGHCTPTSHQSALVCHWSLQAIVLFYLFITSKHSTNDWGCGVNCTYLHLGNWQSSLQQKLGLDSFGTDRKSNVGRGAGGPKGSQAVTADAAKVNWKRKWGLNVLRWVCRITRAKHGQNVTMY